MQRRKTIQIELFILQNRIYLSFEFDFAEANGNGDTLKLLADWLAKRMVNFV